MTLARRVRRLDDIAAITSLTHRYGQAINKGPKGKAVHDARWSSDQLGATVGADAIAAELPTATAMIEFSSHVFLNPAITLDGDSATAAWQLWIASVDEHGPATVYLSADVDYRRTPEGWRMGAIHIGEGIRIPAD